MRTYRSKTELARRAAARRTVENPNSTLAQLDRAWKVLGAEAPAAEAEQSVTVSPELEAALDEWVGKALAWKVGQPFPAPPTATQEELAEYWRPTIEAEQAELAAKRKEAANV